ncbi:amidohydrolase family protein [Flavobacterium gilvum]|uniref:Amidohydrolase n=1 Tax=Flavobacterium gilvum TaxID=1492737 RepID=A0AAC9I300_9FLAO|nr:amidohydrolase family protein [Flavobacterium gilvum]AOW09334.1 amidohydrolase [Flavobacterium gilvum]KFC58944.1 amidohydrolase [Flavobacterium gilvum]
MNKLTTITNAKIFDGENVIEAKTVTIKNGKILNIGNAISQGAEIIDAKGCTLMPALIDAHSHPNMEFLKQDMYFGVTTTFQMQGYFNEAQCKELKENTGIAESLKSFLAITAPDGHPSELLPAEVKAKQKEMMAKAGLTMKKDVSTPEEAIAIVNERVQQGVDYIKIMIEEGTVFGYPNTPDVTDEVIEATCSEAHRLGKMTVAHAMTIKAYERAIEGGIDGLMHIFIDQPHTPEIITAVANSGAFVCPTIVAGASTIGDSDASEFVKDPRVSSKLSPEWIACMENHITTYPQGKTANLLNAVKALHDTGVDILAGSDASQPAVGGMAHGASLHHELQLLVKAGLTPIEALRSAMSIPARRFGLHDRGRIINGARADLLLVEGDPTTNIADTLSIKKVWRQGVEFNLNQLN